VKAVYGVPQEGTISSYNTIFIGREVFSSKFKLSLHAPNLEAQQCFLAPAYEIVFLPLHFIVWPRLAPSYAAA